MIIDYFIQLLTLISIYAIAALALNLAMGFTGLINLGHMVFFGIGAYLSALLTLGGVPWYFSIVIAGIASSVLGITMMAITARLKGDYFAMVTLGLVFIFISVSRNWIEVTRGALGLPGVPKILSNNFHYALLTVGIATLCVLILHKIINSETGKIFQAIRDDEIAAKILGKNTYFYKMLSMAISTFFGGIAGSMFVHQINYVDPTIFNLEFLIFIFTMLIAGGLASLSGSIIGAIVVSASSELLRFVVINPSFVGAFREMLFAIVLLTILLFRPKGILGKVGI